MKRAQILTIFLFITFCNYNLYAQVTVSSQIASSEADVEELLSSGIIRFPSPDLELFNETDGLQAIGLHFKNLNIPIGATITNAYIQFTTDEITTGPVSLNVYAEAVNNPQIWGNINGDVTNRTKTINYVEWSPPDWNVVDESGTDQQTPNLSSVVQEVINRTGYLSSDAINIIIIGNSVGKRTAESYDGSSIGSPKLFITYSFPSDTQAPTAPILSSTAQTETIVDLSWTASIDNIAVTGYKVYKDGILEVTLGNILTHQVTALTAATAYNFTVTALDGAGNESVISNTVAITTNNAVVGNLFDSSTWDIGTGSALGFNRRGTDSENIREMGIGPHGTSELLWKGVSDATTIDDDGGWLTGYININPDKTYRTTVWMKKTNSTDGKIYFGLRVRDALNSFAYKKLDGTSAASHYFLNYPNISINKWYLFVGYIHNKDYTNTAVIGGVYDGDTGVKVLDVTDEFKFVSTSSKLQIQSNLHRGIPNIADALYLYDPTLYEVNGQEPTIQELIDGSGDTQAPTVPILSSTSQTDTTVDLSWTAATDDTAVTGYKVYKDGILEATLGNVLTYQVTALTAATTYNFTVSALDGAGNESVVSNIVDITTSQSSGVGGSSNWTLNNQDVYYNSGNVGIGTTTPDEKLTVKGSIHGEEVKVDLSVPAPDYVFETDYDLTPLEKLQNYIKINKHLPNIPSAKEMEANGIELGIMNMKLLEKIEELTLYVLQQQKLIEKQASGMKEQAKAIKELQKSK